MLSQINQWMVLCDNVLIFIVFNLHATVQCHNLSSRWLPHDHPVGESNSKCSKAEVLRHNRLNYSSLSRIRRFFPEGILTELPNLGSFHSRASQVSSNFSVASLSTIIPISSHVRAVPIRLNAFRQEAHHWVARFGFPESSFLVIASAFRQEHGSKRDSSKLVWLHSRYSHRQCLSAKRTAFL